MEIRKIQRAEAKAYRQIAGYSFGGWDDHVDEADLDAIDLNDTMAVFADDGSGQSQIVSRLINHTFRQSIRGVWRTVSGIGGVCTYPEHRRRGYVRALLNATFEDMRDKGHVGSTLYPFSETFYALFGYVSANSPLRVSLPTHALNHHMAALGAEEAWHIDRKPAIDAVTPFLDFAVEVATDPARVDYHGYMINAQQEAAGWANQMMVFLYEEVNGASVCQAAARYGIKGYGTGEITVHEFHWRTLAGRDRLLGFFALHSDNSPTIRLYVPPTINVQTWLRAPARAFEAQISHLPMMVRVVDVVGSINGIVTEHASAEGVLFTLVDKQCPWNSGTYQLGSHEGALDVERVNSATEIAFTVSGLSALVYGTLSLAEIEHRGWVQGLDDRSRILVDAWFPSQQLFNVKFF